MAEEARTSVASAISRKLWIPFLIWVIALVVSFRGHFLEEWQRNQLLIAIKTSDQRAIESMFNKGWYPDNGTFRNPKSPFLFSSLLDFALAAGNQQAARFLWENLPFLHERGVLSSAWKIAAKYGYPEGLIFMHGIDPAINSASLTQLMGDSVNYPGLTSDIKIPAADYQQHLFTLELFVTWGANPASSTADTLKRAIDSGLADCAAFLIKHEAPCVPAKDGQYPKSSTDGPETHGPSMAFSGHTPHRVDRTFLEGASSGLLLHAVLRQKDLSPAKKEMLSSLLLEMGVSAAQADKTGIKAIDLAEDLVKKFPVPEHTRIVDMMKNPPVHAPLATESPKDGASQ